MFKTIGVRGVVWASVVVVAAFSLLFGVGLPGSEGDGGLALLGFGGMMLTPDNLKRLQNGFNGAFLRGIEAVPNTYSLIAMTVSSKARVENYGWMKGLPGMREWVGQRVINNLEVTGASLENKPWENTIGVDRFAVDDDDIGLYALKFSQQGEVVARHPNDLVWGLLRKAFTTRGFDGQYFIDTDHVGYSVEGVETSWSNSGGGAGKAWFLMDLSRAYMKPLVFQERMKPEFVYKTNPTDDNVFMENQLLFGATARYNAGFGFHQLAYGSKQSLTAVNYQAGRVALSTQYRPDGSALGVSATHLVVGPSNEAAALELLQAERDAAGATNVYRGTAKLVVSPYLE